ncbi:hypothetical protein B0H34DRAFT_665569 [Crassisporium funariophilum]|nr:hypothetical protein B0H34DRAFT_665569 [Crassisporium funariophilum]
MAEIPNVVEVIDLTGLSDSSESGSEDGREDDEEDGSEHGSDGSEIEITLNEETRSQLQTAIATVSETRLRQLLKILVETDISIEAALTRELVTLKRGTQNVVPRWDCCGNCEEEFDTNTIREDMECVFHPGELKVDKENNGDEDTDGQMDSSNNPQNFRWSCCAGTRVASGCVRGEHRPVVSRKRKRHEE